MNTALLIGVFALAIGLGMGSTDVVSTRPSRNVLEDPEAQGGAASVPFARIASLTTVSDQILLELVDPGRMVAVTSRTQRDPRLRNRLPTIQGFDTVRDAESVLALAPDLVILSAFTDVRVAHQLESAGVRVHIVGSMTGVSSVVDEALKLGALLSEQGTAEALVHTFRRRLERVTREPATDRPSAMYLSLFGTRLYGGTRGSSYHDVLTAAGFFDAPSARGFTGWPEYSFEDILQIDPDWLVVSESHERAICEHDVLRRLRACVSGCVITASSDELSDPGLGMLPTAELINDRYLAQRSPRCR